MQAVMIRSARAAASGSSGERSSAPRSTAASPLSPASAILGSWGATAASAVSAGRPYTLADASGSIAAVQLETVRPRNTVSSSGVRRSMERLGNARASGGRVCIGFSKETGREASTTCHGPWSVHPWSRRPSPAGLATSSVRNWLQTAQARCDAATSSRPREGLRRKSDACPPLPHPQF